MIDLDAVIDEALDGYGTDTGVDAATAVEEAVKETVRQVVAACRKYGQTADTNGNHVAAATARYLANAFEGEL